MATKSIFDCDSIENESKREQIVYDEDWFSCGNELPSDENDAAPKSVSISVTISRIDKGRVKNGKRHASDLELEGRPNLKAKKNNVPTINVTSNGRDRQTVLGNRKYKEYELLKEIGRGTYGSVFKAKLNNNDTIAVKRLTCKLNQPSTIKHLAFSKREYVNLREAQDCNNILRLLKGSEREISKDTLQIDMLLEYCPHNLQKLLWHTSISLKFEEIKSFLRQILLGLSHIHHKSIMHRDLKTENILLTVDGVVKIADFGLSRKLCDASYILAKQQYTPNMVTQWYRAPEILLGDTRYNESSDIWSFGCLMGEFWHRNAIFPGKSELDQIKLISKLCGSMTPEIWPNIVNLKNYEMISLMPTNERIIRSYLKNKAPFVKGNQANDLLDKLLRYNPEKRLTALVALNDDFFYSDPLPVKNLKQFMSRSIPFLVS